MATVRSRERKDGSTYWQVRFRADGKESSESLDNEADAEAFRALVERVGGRRAREIRRLEGKHTSTTVAAWVKHHIDHLSGVKGRTTHEYRGVLKNDIEPALVPVPLAELPRDDIARWLETMRSAGHQERPSPTSTVCSRRR
ncbi:hypothetical protein [Mycolicibacterium sp. CH28]|uniref:hypothetical protein n=1 Tax=Mycolicibacterium sp. CH28 TaxID=2512237 RepID=UPI001F421059|nr:hypothetical protein [Mycolicibacterium sp. CH28]